MDVPGFGPVRGDVAWGGNWFFLVEDHGQELTLANVERLTAFTWTIRQGLFARESPGPKAPRSITSSCLAPPSLLGTQACRRTARTLCYVQGKDYDRSPCGTGTSAKLACLVADGKLKPGQVGGRRASSAASSRGVWRSIKDRWCRRSPAVPSSPPRANCS